MPPHDLLRLRTRTRLFYPPNVQRAILPLERAYTTHVVSVVGKLVSREAVLGRVRERGRRVGEHVPVLALPAVRTAAAREEETTVLDPRRVRPREAGVALNVASRLGLGLAGG